MTASPFSLHAVPPSPVPGALVPERRQHVRRGQRRRQTRRRPANPAHRPEDVDRRRLRPLNRTGRAARQQPSRYASQPWHPPPLLYPHAEALLVAADTDAMVEREAPAILELLADGVPRSRRTIAAELADRHPKDDVRRTLM